jgi:hypothetical protein
MNNIIEPDQLFDFTKISLANPSGVQGGAYFTKILHNSKPLYIQTQQSLTRQGFVKTGKKFYIDLMFDNNSTNTINWFENLEDRCQKLLYEKSESWFQNTLELNDIETAFNSTIRVYKSGKYYLVRTNIKNLHNNIPGVKIYNEQELPLTIDDVNSETSIISILEIQGIKFTSRNFQIEIELKQVMVLDNEPIFDNCLIKTNKKASDVTENLEDKIFTETIHDNKIENLNEDIIDTENKKLEELPSIDSIITKLENQKNSEESIPINLEIEDLNEDIEENNNELKEVQNLDLDLHLDLEKNLETIQLKKPNQVYFELYKEARNKAKIAKKNALLAYLEAKNIKKTYLIENLEDSDSDIDAEIEEVSESELDGL